MVCTFMLFVLPALVLRGVYWLWGWFFGKKQQPKAQVPAAKDADADKKKAAKGFCPYHFVMWLLGCKIPEKKQQQQLQDQNEADTTAETVKAQ